MAIEYKHLVLVADESVIQQIQQLLAEGWTLIPGAAPLLIYHLQREEATAQPTLGLTIKEEGITIIKAKPEGEVPNG